MYFVAIGVVLLVLKVAEFGMVATWPWWGILSPFGVAMGPDALRAPAGPLPADPADDVNLPPELAGLKAEVLVWVILLTLSGIIYVITAAT